ncbi:chromate efflux transporter [Mameliella sp. AT18]|uniref:chromate efflux transporter n=1 Tax=Mameliella sp. AT18 TaxID=3028385 RepID=UPI0008411B5E|nr:chromate efflux transporter [Mameliella sp. AT18]MDD9728814.1 chromate efflux transporter [Mameliella sp. AT18]ODM49147.1 chromate transporter [Ruegeria sp. PBVC088]
MTAYSTLIQVFGRIGVLSFGGPAAQIALMHRELVEERPWLTEQQFLRSLSFCMLLPGPEAMQLATYAGWRLRGIPGGLIAGGLFVLPGAVVIALLALLYAQYGARPETEALLLGVKACVVVIVAQALVRLSQKALKGAADYLVATLSFLAIFLLGLPFPLIIALAALWGAFRASAPVETPPEPATRKTRPATIALWAALWLMPLPVLWLTGQDLLFDLALFFAKLAVVTFGGAYAVLAYMAQEVVETRAWLDATQMVDALGLAETTPGPLILVTQFVGQLTGHAQGGPWLALAAGGLTLWMTFAPCFLWIFAGAPYIENLLARPRLQSALAAITAAVVGVILNLSLWFALHVVFATLTPVALGPVTLDLPRPDTLRWEVLPLTALATVLLVWAKRGVPVTLALSAALGWALVNV